MENLAFKSLLRRPFQRAIVGITGVLAFRIVLKIYYKLFSKYLVAKNIVGSFKVRLRVEDPFNLSISLSIEEKSKEIEAKKATDGAIEAQSLRKCQQTQTEVIL